LSDLCPTSTCRLVDLVRPDGRPECRTCRPDFALTDRAKGQVGTLTGPCRQGDVILKSVSVRQGSVRGLPGWTGGGHVPVCPRTDDLPTPDRGWTLSGHCPGWKIICPPPSPGRTGIFRARVHPKSYPPGKIELDQFRGSVRPGIGTAQEVLGAARPQVTAAQVAAQLLLRAAAEHLLSSWLSSCDLRSSISEQ
jgi:hypothetical protein